MTAERRLQPPPAPLRRCPLVVPGSRRGGSTSLIKHTIWRGRGLQGSTQLLLTPPPLSSVPKLLPEFEVSRRYVGRFLSEARLHSGCSLFVLDKRSVFLGGVSAGEKRRFAWRRCRPPTGGVDLLPGSGSSGGRLLEAAGCCWRGSARSSVVLTAGRPPVLLQSEGFL